MKLFAKKLIGKKEVEAAAQEPLCFGVPLDPESHIIPPIVEKCTTWLLKHGTTVEGVFRLSANFATLEELRAKFDRGEDVDLEATLNLPAAGGKTSAMVDPHSVAGLLKKWFRELPEPLCTTEMYDMWMAAASIKDIPTQLIQVKKVLSFCPPANQRLIKYLASFLRQFATHSEVTKMTAVNLSICFAPNLLRAPDTLGLQDQIEESPIATGLLVMFIEQFDNVFEEPAPKKTEFQRPTPSTPPPQNHTPKIPPKPVLVKSPSSSSATSAHTPDSSSSPSHGTSDAPSVPGGKPNPKLAKRSSSAFPGGLQTDEASNDSGFITSQSRSLSRPASGIGIGSSRNSQQLDEPVGGTHTSSPPPSHPPPEPTSTNPTPSSSTPPPIAAKPLHLRRSVKVSAAAVARMGEDSNGSSSNLSNSTDNTSSTGAGQP